MKDCWVNKWLKCSSFSLNVLCWSSGNSNKSGSGSWECLVHPESHQFKHFLRKQLTCLGKWKENLAISYMLCVFHKANKCNVWPCLDSDLTKPSVKIFIRQVGKSELWLDIWWYWSIIIMRYDKGITIMLGKKNPYLLGKHTDMLVGEMIWSLGFLQVNIK